MVQGTINAITDRLRAALAGEGIQVGEESLGRIVDALHVPLEAAMCDTCGTCDGAGVVDSGGQDQTSGWVNVTCPACNGTGRKGG